MQSRTSRASNFLTRRLSRVSATRQVVAETPDLHLYPRSACVPQLVATQAANHPEGVALVTWNEVVTYSDLEQRANQLARYLRVLGVGRDTLVALCLPRSATLVISQLAVLKTGGAYVPFDPAYPPERSLSALHDARPSVLLTRQPVAQGLTAGEWKTVNLDDDASEIASHSGDLFDCTVRPEDLAYVIYTSGSTGRPKGVQITHDSLLNLVFWHRRAFGVIPADRASQLASPGFDAAVWEVWPYLTAGASVHMPADWIRSDPESLRNWIVSERITIGFAATPLAERIIALKWPRETALRLLLTGADTLYSYPPSNLPFTVVNNYGPTECTVVATSGTVPPNSQRNVPPSIGRPISNVQIYILDEQLREVPIGEPGEIYIGGVGLSRGYLNAPELTAAKFIVSPFDSGGTRRIYKTGDLGRYLPDGQIAFLGRIDDQIKLRGFRIEPNEIVAALLANPMVQASYVLARENTPADKQLVAYIVPKPGSCPTGQALRQFLSSQLPDYMIPGFFVRVDELPLNANGKVDRAELPSSNPSNSLDFDTYVEPGTPIERRIAEILSPLLGVEKIGLKDNFFSLGGHSLLGTQLIARMREAFSVELSLRSLFDSPTVTSLAAEVERLLYLRLEAMSEEEAKQFLETTPRHGAGASLNAG